MLWIFPFWAAVSIEQSPVATRPKILVQVASPFFVAPFTEVACKGSVASVKIAPTGVVVAQPENINKLTKKKL